MDVRDRLLEAAAKVYAELGYRGATTRRIAQEAGVNELTLFRHFGSKAELIHRAIGACRPGPMAALLPERPADPAAELGAWAEGLVAELHRHQALIRTALGEVEEHPELIRPSEDPMVQAGEALAGYLERVRVAGLAAGDFDARTVASLLLSALFVDAIVRDVMPGIFGADLSHDARAYVATVLRGIGVELREMRADG